MAGTVTEEVYFVTNVFAVAGFRELHFVPLEGYGRASLGGERNNCWNGGNRGNTNSETSRGTNGIPIL